MKFRSNTEGRKRRETIKLAGRNLYEEYNQALQPGRRRKKKKK